MKFFVIYDMDPIFGEMYFVDLGGTMARAAPRFSIKLSRAQRFATRRGAYEFAGRFPSMCNCRVGERLLVVKT